MTDPLGPHARDEQASEHEGDARGEGDVRQPPCVPNLDDMREMVDVLFRHAMRGLIEMVWSTPAPGTTERQRLDNAQMFGLTDDDKEGMVEFAAQLNARTTTNCYIASGLRDEAVARAHSHRGERDVISVPALWADCDDPGVYDAALEICERIGMRPSLAVITGEHPHRRGALYWVLEEPTGSDEFDRIKDIHGRFVRLFKSDPAVTNPAALMRFAGSMAWPVKVGRRLEMTRVDREAKRREAPYMLDEIDALSRKALMASASNGGANSADASPEPDLDLNEAKAQFDFDALVEEAKRPGHWRNAARSLVAHLYSLGTPEAVIVDMLTRLLRQPDYSDADTRADLAVLIQGCRKWDRGERCERPREEPDFDDESKSGEYFREAGAKAASEEFPTYTMADLLAPEAPPRWLIKDVIPETGLGVMFGDAAVFKSFAVHDAGARVACGIGWFEKRVRAAPVAYLCGEGFSGFRTRMKGWMMTREGYLTEEQRALAYQNFVAIDAAVDLLDRTLVLRLANHLLALPNPPRLIIVDTLARYFGVGEESKTSDMNRFVYGCGYLQRALNAFVLVVHHSGKDPTRGERGSTVLRGAEDARYRVTREQDEMSCKITVEKMKNGTEGARFAPRMVRVVVDVDEDGDEVSTLVPVCEGGAMEGAPRGGPDKPRNVGKLTANHLAVLYALREGPLSFKDIFAVAGIKNEGSVWRVLEALRRDGDLWSLADRDDPNKGDGEGEERPSACDF